MKTRKLITVLITSLLSFALCGCGTRSLPPDYRVTNVYGHLYDYYYRPFQPSGNSTSVTEPIEETVTVTEPVEETVTVAEPDDTSVEESVEAEEESSVPVSYSGENDCAPEEGLPGWVEMNAYTAKDDMIASALDSTLTVYYDQPNETAYPFITLHRFDANGNQIETIWYVVIDNSELAETIYKDCFLPDSQYDNWGKSDGYFGDIWKINHNVIFGIVPTESTTRTTFESWMSSYGPDSSIKVYYK